MNFSFFSSTENRIDSVNKEILTRALLPAKLYIKMRTQTHTPIHSHNSKTQHKHAEYQLRALNKITRLQAYRILVDFCPIFDHSLTKTHKLTLTQSESKCYTQKSTTH